LDTPSYIVRIFRSKKIVMSCNVTFCSVMQIITRISISKWNCEKEILFTLRAPGEDT